MSLDMYVHVEQRDPAPGTQAWLRVEGPGRNGKWPLNEHRDSDFFDLLGWDEGLSAIPHRDYPEGDSSAHWAPVMAYASLRELVEFDWNQEYRSDSPGKHEEGVRRTYADVAAELLVMLLKLREIGNPDDVRIVFSFDY